MRYREAEHPIAYSVVRPALGAFERLAHNFYASGRENILRGIGAVAVFPHRDAYDSIGAGVALTRPVYFMAKNEMWTDQYTKRILGVELNAGRIVGYFGSFAVDREHPSHDTVRYARNLARSGRVVGIYPEMSRYIDEDTKELRGQKLGHLFEGAGSIAVTANVPILPVGLRVHRERNADGKNKVKRIAAVIRPPLELSEDEKRELSRREATALLMERLRPNLQSAFDEATEIAAGIKL